MEDSNFKTKYIKCKLKVKQWESEYKKEHGVNPSKSDIKNAPTNIKDAYKKYYTLKTMALENSLLGASIGDEDTMDGLSTSVDCSDEANTSNSVSTSTENVDLKINYQDSNSKLTQHNDSKKPLDVSNISRDVQQEDTKAESLSKIHNPNKSTVWGPHLNKKPKAKKNESIMPSSSLSYTAKLFPGAKFNKRNPRKSYSFTKTKKINESVCENTNVFHSENSLSSYELKTQPSEIINEANTEPLVCNLVNDKIKIVNIKLSSTTQPVSLLQKTLDNESNEVLPLRKLDTGWVERTAQNNILEINKLSNFSDSGIDLKDSSVSSSNSSNLKITSTNNEYSVIDTSDNDEDFIYDSDSEMENKNRLNISHVSFKRSLNSTIERLSKRCKIESNNAPHSQTLSLVVSSHLQSNNFDSKTNKEKINSPINCNKVNSFETKTVNICPNIVDEKHIPNTCLDSKPIEKIKCKTSGISLVEKCSSLLENSEQAGKTKRKIVRSKLTLQERLEQKMASGKGNENFVRVNIQKKVYVRGKKTMTFSKFKKKQWKTNQKNLHGRGSSQSGVLKKCFKCGDVGHFSKTCMKGNEQLLPQDEDEEDESIFPTLEEAEEMAKECAQRLFIKKKDSEFQREEMSDTASDVENRADFLQQPEPIEDMPMYPSVEPIFLPNEDGSLIETPFNVFETLKQFGHETFRSGQEQIIMRILSGLSTLVTLATGTGKSLCYQLPAFLYYKYRKSITLVVSPLVSLMEDQVAKSSTCLKIACLHSGQPPKKRELIIEQLKNNELSVLLVSPETVVHGERLGINNVLRHLPPIAFACVDEAHCVSQWSHNFRPSYLTIFQVLREKLGVKTILGLTATATSSTMSSIAAHIGVPDGERGIIRDTPVPNNLVLTISKEKKKDLALITLLKGPHYSSCESIIVYCTRREECDRLGAYLRTCLQDVCKENYTNKRGNISWIAEAYHAGLSASRRQTIQNAFMAGKLRIVIATVAFGMGINKRDIRGIIHYNMPSTFESYVQEVGRAGRDGLPAFCHLFLDSESCDLNELRRHIYANSTERHTIRKLLQRVFVPCNCKEKCPWHEVAFSIEDTVKALDLRKEIISTLLCYLELDKKKWAEVLTPVYTLCRIHSYKGTKYLKKAAKECAPLAMAIAMQIKRSGNHKLDKMTTLEFSVYEVASAINWDCGVVKHHLKNLEWTTENDRPKRSGLMVELTDLGFRLRAPGNLSGDELDAALDSLYSRVELQETTSLKKLQATFQAFVEVSYKSVEDCMQKINSEHCEILKTRIRDYFTKEGQLEDISLPKVALENEDQVVSDIRNLICTYRDCSFTGRAIARIFHGIESPNFLALTWYNCRYWRQHLNQNFNTLCKVATRELLLMR